MRKEKI